MRAVEDRDPVYSAEPVPILVFGARCSPWESDLWSRPDRTWTTPSCWTERGLNYGPVSTWYRSRSCFPPTGCASARPPVRRNLFVRVTRGPVSGYSLAHHRRLVPAQKNWSIQRGMLPPGTMTTVHSNVYEHRATKCIQLAFDSHFSDPFCAVSCRGYKKLVHPEGDAAALPSFCHGPQWS